MEGGYESMINGGGRVFRILLPGLSIRATHISWKCNVKKFLYMIQNKFQNCTLHIIRSPEVIMLSRGCLREFAHKIWLNLPLRELEEID